MKPRWFIFILLLRVFGRRRAWRIDLSRACSIPLRESYFSVLRGTSRLWQDFAAQANSFSGLARAANLPEDKTADDSFGKWSFSMPMAKFRIRGFWPHRSDVLADRKIRIVSKFPDNTHPPIIYAAALTTTATVSAAAFFKWLNAPAIQSACRKSGF